MKHLHNKYTPRQSLNLTHSHVNIATGNTCKQETPTPQGHLDSPRNIPVFQGSQLYLWEGS